MVVLDMLVAALVAVLAGLGVGSGGLLVLWLTLVRGVPQLTAQGINLLFFVAAATAALLRYSAKRQINTRAATLLSLTGLVGCAVGTHLAHLLPAHLLTAGFGWFMVLVGVYTLVKR